MRAAAFWPKVYAQIQYSDISSKFCIGTYKFNNVLEFRWELNQGNFRKSWESLQVLNIFTWTLQLFMGSLEPKRDITWITGYFPLIGRKRGYCETLKKQPNIILVFNMMNNVFRKKKRKHIKSGISWNWICEQSWSSFTNHFHTITNENDFRFRF